MFETWLAVLAQLLRSTNVSDGEPFLGVKIETIEHGTFGATPDGNPVDRFVVIRRATDVKSEHCVRDRWNRGGP